MRRSFLTDAEVKRLEKYIEQNVSQEAVAVGWGVSASTLSRAMHKHHVPSPMLRNKLIEAGIILIKGVRHAVAA